MAWKWRSLFVLPLIVFFCSLLGGFYGPRVQVAAAASDHEDLAFAPDLDNFTKAYALIEQSSASPIDPNKAIYKGTLPGMLRTLDPHSNFFDPRDYQMLKDDQQGHYFGVGMEVSTRNGKTVVMAPFSGSPAWKAGLRPGDIIVFVNDKPTDNLNTTEVADLLKGPRGTAVKIVVSREGAADYLTFSVVRDEIIRKSVPDAFMVRPGIVYVKILSFGEHTSQELDANLKRIGENNIKGMVLDLRENPGGLLSEAVAVDDHFLQKGALIVSQHGRSSPEKSYVARTGNHGRDYPMVVLVDRMSASAAEIVSGALQDHDRGWILGETTFGKGLVQTLYQLSENTCLALTTAHFYTPSGRLIQRDYSKQSFYDYYEHKDGTPRNPLDVKMTDSGRTVYGGGGITPDQVYKTPTMDRLETELYRNGLFNFTRSYFVEHRDGLPKGWMPDEQVITELHDYLLKNNYTLTDAEFTRDHDWTRRYLAREMYVYAFNKDESDRLFATTDPEVAAAVQAMPKAEALVENARKVVVQRMPPQQQGGVHAQNHDR